MYIGGGTSGIGGGAVRELLLEEDGTCERRYRAMDFVLEKSFFSLCGRAGGSAGGGAAWRTDLYRENFCVMGVVVVD